MVTRLAVLPLALVSCADVLDLTDRIDAVEQLCACTDEVPQFDGRCVEVLSDRLSGVSAATRGAWLENYAARCGAPTEGVCPNAYDCYSQPGTCAALACGVDRECCGFAQGATCNPEGLCETQ